MRKLTGKDLVPNLQSYPKYVDYVSKLPLPAHKLYPCVTPGWDNAARRKISFFAFLGSTPKLYGRWLRNVLRRFKPYSVEENFVFINAWNEWAEGNHLEPDLKWGRAYLEETRRALAADSRNNTHGHDSISRH